MVPPNNDRVHSDILLEAVAKTGVRALISMGWSGLGERALPENVFALGEFSPEIISTGVLP